VSTRNAGLAHADQPSRASRSAGPAPISIAVAPAKDGDGAENQPQSWRDEAIEGFADLDITIIDPRSERWPGLEPGSPGRRGAFEWQCANAFAADVVIVWVPENRHAPTALMILGGLGVKRNNAKKGSSVVVGGNGWDGLVKLYAQNQRLFPAGDDLREVIRIARLQVDKLLA